MDLNGVMNKTRKLKPLMDLKNYIVKKIDNNQSIKRYCKYLTYEPLELTSINYSGVAVNQPDIKESLIEDIKDLNKSANIIPYTLNNTDSILEKKVLIFIHNYKNDLRGKMGEITFMVDIACPKLFNKLPFGEERIYKIAEQIIEELDDKYVEEPYIDSIGAYKFRVDGIGKEWIYEDNKAIVYSFPICVYCNNDR